MHWAYQENHRENYEKVAGKNSPGCNLSFELEEDFESFYNRLEMLKSPSFGTEFSNCCPYVYLAHYSMIQSKADGTNFRVQEYLPTFSVCPLDWNRLIKSSVRLKKPCNKKLPTLQRGAFAENAW